VNVPKRRDGLVQPTGSGLAFVDRHGNRVLRRGLAGRAGSAWFARNFQLRSGRAVHHAAFTGVLAASGVRISMDGKGRYLDNIFIERLWRSLKYEDIYIKAYASVLEARRGIGGWLSFYNDERLHQALGYQTPREVFQATVSCGYVDNASALTTSPQAHHQQQERDSIELEKAL
jgi:transposase InsO family protein